MKYACLLLLLAPAVFAQTTITTSPTTPAPNEPFNVTVHGVWPNGCVPAFQSMNLAGSTIVITAMQSDCTQACPQIVSAYSFVTTSTMLPMGLYTIEYHIVDCKQNDTIAASQQLLVSPLCPFDRALHASAPAAQVGGSVLLHWCDPSFSPGPDQGISASFFRVLVSRSESGPFVPVGDLQAINVGLTFDPSDVGSLFFFVEAHMCNITIAGCSGDTVLRSNIVRVDVVPAGGCLPDATTLCLNNSRFQVRAHWTTNDGQSGDGQAVPFASDSGWFWFFGPDNVELVTKVLNGCSAASPSYWFFASGLTNVGVDITVTDTKTGTTKVYHNPLNQPFTAIQDTSAFATCP